MSRRWPAIALAWLAAPALASAEPKPFAWTNVHPRAVTVGQPVTLTVDVYVPSFFTGAPRFPQLEVKDAVVIFIDEGTNLSQSFGGKEYAGQRRSYKIYPQREGAFEVPDFAVKVGFSGEGGVPTRVPAPAKGGSFQATLPAGARGVDHFLATSALSVQADSDRPLTGLRTGDSFTRTITMTAADAFAMMLPPLAFPAVDGLAVYPAQPRVADRGGERDEPRVAERVESVTYVLQKPGTYRLPASDVAWWDTRAQTLRHAPVPALDFTVEAAPASQSEIPLPQDPAERQAAPDPWRPLREALRRYGPAALVLLVAAALLLRLLRAPLHAILGRRAALRRAREEAPAAYLARVAEAARSGRPKELLAATYRWLDRRPRTAAEAARLDRFVQQSGDAELPEMQAALVDAALETEEVSDVESSERFAKALARAAFRGAPAAPPPPESLGPLNPS